MMSGGDSKGWLLVSVVALAACGDDVTAGQALEDEIVAPSQMKAVEDGVGFPAKSNGLRHGVSDSGLWAVAAPPFILPDSWDIQSLLGFPGSHIGR